MTHPRNLSDDNVSGVPGPQEIHFCFKMENVVISLGNLFKLFTILCGMVLKYLMECR